MLRTPPQLSRSPSPEGRGPVPSQPSEGDSVSPTFPRLLLSPEDGMAPTPTVDADSCVNMDSFSVFAGKQAQLIIKIITEGKSLTKVNKLRIINECERLKDRAGTQPPSSPATTSGQPEPANSDSLRELIEAGVGTIKDTIRAEMAKIRAPPPLESQSRTYSRVTGGEGSPRTGRTTQGSVPKPCDGNNKNLPAIIVTPTGEVKSKQDSIEAFKKSISFRTSNYAPARVQCVSNGKLRVEFDNQEQREETLVRLSNSTQVKAEAARQLRPMVILKGISRDVPSEEIVGILRNQNSELKNIIGDEEDLRLRFKRNNRNPTLYNAVFLAHPRVYRVMMDMVRVSLDHQRIYVDNFSPFIQCHKCFQFGHMRAKCDSITILCAHCAEIGHDVDHCPLREKPFTARCLNCISHNNRFKTRLDIRHCANSFECPRLRNMKSKITNRVDYGL